MKQDEEIIMNQIRLQSSNSNKKEKLSLQEL